MAIFAIALVMICLSSVSAVEENDFNSTLETVNDNSQNENIVIDEITENNADDINEVNSVSVESEKQVLEKKEVLKASFKDASGKPLANTEVTFKVGSKTYTVVTDENGVAKLNKKLAVGKYTVISTNPVTGESSTNSLTIVNRLIKNKDITMDFLDGTIFKVQAIGDDGKPVGAGQIVKIKVHGVTYKCKTDKNGWAYRSIGLVPKTYTITATYKGVTTKNKLVVKQTLKSSNVKVKKSAKKLTLKATLKSSKGKAIKGKTIKFRFKGKIYSAKTNSKGIAKVVLKKSVINKLKAGKKYKVYVIYNKDKIQKTLTVRR